MPKAILNDREEALLNALDEVFPETPTILYEWHINKDIQAKLHKLGGNFAQVPRQDVAGRTYWIESELSNQFMSDWQVVLRSTDEQSFEEQRKELH